MAFTMSFPLISASAGTSSEGICVGTIVRSAFAGAVSSVTISSDRKVFRLDRAGGSLNIIDDTVAATSGTANAFLPFGNNVIPSGATLRAYDSSDGSWASSALTLTAVNASGSPVANPTDCLRSTGWCRLDFGENANRQSWRPSLDPATNIPSRKYIRIELDDGGDRDSFIVACGAGDIRGLFLNVTTAGSTTAPTKLAEVVLWRVDGSTKYTDITAQLNGDLAALPTGLPATFVQTVGHTVQYAFTSRAYGIERTVYRSLGGPVSAAVEYLAADNTWKPLAGHSDASNFLQNGPTTDTTPGTNYAVRWTIPADWTSKTQSFVQESDGATFSKTGFWIRYRVTAAPISPVRYPVSRGRVRQFSNDDVQGIASPVARTIRGLTITQMGAANAAVIEAQCINGASGDAQAFTIPANPTLPLAVTFASAMSIAAGDEVLPVVVTSGGGVATAAEIIFHE